MLIMSDQTDLSHPSTAETVLHICHQVDADLQAEQEAYCIYMEKIRSKLAQSRNSTAH